MGIDYEEKAFYDILKAVARKYEFEYPDVYKRQHEDTALKITNHLRVVKP